MNAEAKSSPRPLAGEGPGVRAAGNHRRVNPYVQVVLTYVRGPFGVLSAWGILFLIVVGVWFRLSQSDRSSDAWFDTPSVFLLMMFLMWFSALSIHIIEQFADPRAHITPNYRRVHAVVAGIATLIVVVVSPAALAWVAGMRSIGLVAVAVMLIGSIFLSYTIRTGRLALVVWLLLGAAWLAVMGGLRELTSGQHELLAAAILLIGAAMTLIGGNRLIRFTEEIPEDGSSTRWNPTTAEQLVVSYRGNEGATRNRLFVYTMERHIERRIEHARRASTSQWSAICRWGVGSIADWYFWLFVAGVPLCFQLVKWTLAPLPFPTFVFFLPCFLIPAFLTVGTRIWRADVMPYEIMMPVKRSAYLRQVGLTFAVKLFRLWLGIAVATVCWLLVAAPKSVHPSEIAGCFVVSASCQVWVLGVAVLFARIRDISAAQVGTPMIVFGVLGIAAQLTTWQWTPWLIAGTFSLLGLLLMYAAYGRWLVADID